MLHLTHTQPHGYLLSNSSFLFFKEVADGFCSHAVLIFLFYDTGFPRRESHFQLSPLLRLHFTDARYEMWNKGQKVYSFKTFCLIPRIINNRKNVFVCEFPLFITQNLEFTCLFFESYFCLLGGF